MVTEMQGTWILCELRYAGTLQVQRSSSTAATSRARRDGFPEPNAAAGSYLPINRADQENALARMRQLFTATLPGCDVRHFPRT